MTRRRKETGTVRISDEVTPQQTFQNSKMMIHKEVPIKTNWNRRFKTGIIGISCFKFSNS